MTAEGRWKAAIIAWIRTLNALKIMQKWEKNVLAQSWLEPGTFRMQKEDLTTALLRQTINKARGIEI